MKPLLFIFLLMISISSHAVDSRQLSDPKQQESYETLTKELRCLVCQNQTIADSNAIRGQNQPFVDSPRSVSIYGFDDDVFRYSTQKGNGTG
jgi:Cytochrome C biogenesis protein